MKKILLSAFMCDPYSGSEAGYGWSWSEGLVREGFEVHCITRTIHKKSIEKHPEINNLKIHYVSLPFGLERFYTLSQVTMYIYYILWQWKAYRKARQLNKRYRFDRVHHVTWGSIQQGSFLYKLNIPLIFGPAGGGQQASVKFKDYFLNHWTAEEKREKVSKFLVRYNPACKNMLQSARAVLVSNIDTYELAKKAGGKNIFITLDTALPESFFPEKYILHKPKRGQLKLLWIGRFLPRKGILLVLDVMNALKAHPEITLTIVGDGEMRQAADEKYLELGLQQTVTFTGTIPYHQVQEYYASHEAFFFTSLRESGGVQLVEAMAYGLPVITLDIHGSAEIVNEFTGIKIPLSEPKLVIEALAKAIVELSNDTTRYHSMSLAAHQFACEQTWEKKIKDIVEKYY
jgi:glycosyltransferase involved in cell wall biosynthesis